MTNEKPRIDENSKKLALYRQALLELLNEADVWRENDPSIWGPAGWYTGDEQPSRMTLSPDVVALLDDLKQDA